MNQNIAWNFRGTACGFLALLCLNAHGADKAAQCTDDPMHQQQDFALGSWNVYGAGEKIAEVRLEKALSGCAIHEVWTAIKGKAENGLGLFAYSRLMKGWGYFWVSDTGWTTTFTGGAPQNPGTMMYVTGA